MTPTSKFISKKQKTNYRMLDYDHDSPGAGKRIWVVPEGSKDYAELKYYDCMPEPSWLKVVSVEECFDILCKWLKEYGSTINEKTKPMPTVAPRVMFNSLKGEGNYYGITLKITQSFIQALKNTVFSEVENLDEQEKRI